MNELMSAKDINLSPLDTRTRALAQQILDENDANKVKDLTTLFNLNAQKRNVVRVMRMNELLDKVTDQVFERFERTPDNFSNEDLLKYMQVTEGAIEKANKQLNLIDETPPIQYQQNNQVNVNIIDSCDRESRERIAAVISKVLQGQPTIISTDVDNGKDVDDNE